MFGSQAVETAIGFALLFWVLTSAASAIVEAISRLTHKRARDLEAVIHDMLMGPDSQARAGATAGSGTGTGTAPEESAAMRALRGTSMYGSAMAAAERGRQILPSDKARPAYLSARAFADAIVELLDDEASFTEAMGWDGLRKRLKVLTTEADAGMLDVKAGLESWFDETMGRLQDAYKRWATAVLFVVGLGLAVVGNVSTIDTASGLWQDSATRQVAIDAAAAAAAKGATVAANVQSIQDLQQLGLPLGWHGVPGWGWWWVSHIVGWLITALLLMLGAPFWFDALSKLVSMGTSGVKPPTAAQDQASAVSRLTAAATAAAAASAAPSAADAGFRPAGAVAAGAQAAPEPLMTRIREGVRSRPSE
jgi:hypothetical protein